MLTAWNIINFEVMQTAKVKTAFNYLSERIVEWVSVIELPVENFVRKNEFVLSTGIGYGGDASLFQQFVQDVFDSGASALALAMGRYIFDIPQQILSFAEENQFLIIEIPWEVRFADIQHAVMQELNKQKELEYKRAEEVGQELLHIMLQSGNISHVANFVSEKINHPIIVTNKAGTIKGQSHHAAPFVDMFMQNKQSAVTSVKDHQHPLQTKLENVKIGEHEIWKIPIQTASFIQGYMVVFLPSDQYKVEKIRVLEQASTVLAMWFMRINAIEETEMRLRGDFIVSLAKGEVYSLEKAAAQGKSLGYHLNLPYICVVATAEQLPEHYQNSHIKTPFSQWEESILHYIEEESFYAASKLSRKGMVTIYNKTVIIYLEITTEHESESVNHFLDLVERRLSSLIPGIFVSWGIGRYHSGQHMFQLSYEDAVVALDIGRKKKGEANRTFFDDTKIDRTLMNLAQNPEMEALVKETIFPLIQYDQQRQMDLITTFITYNENQGKISQTSRYLNLHRQSLLYRLRKIEKLTGLSLVNPDDRFLLDLSIKIWCLTPSDLKR